MDIKLLDQFARVPRYRSLSQAAMAMNTSVSTLSRNIAKLEHAVGQALIRREGKSITLTVAGQELLQTAVEISARWSELKSKLASNTLVSGQVRLYCSVTAAYSLVAQALTLLNKEQPNVEVLVETGDAARAIEKLQNNEADFAIAPLTATQPDGIVAREIVETDLAFVVNKAKAPESLRLIDALAQDLQFIVPERGLVRERFVAWSQQAGVQPSIYAKVAGHEAIASMASLGIGIGIVPRLVLESSPMRSQLVELNTIVAPKPITVGLCAREKALVDQAVAACWQSLAGIELK